MIDGENSKTKACPGGKKLQFHVLLFDSHGKIHNIWCYFIWCYMMIMHRKKDKQNGHHNPLHRYWEHFKSQESIKKKSCTFWVSICYFWTVFGKMATTIPCRGDGNKLGLIISSWGWTTNCFWLLSYFSGHHWFWPN